MAAAERSMNAISTNENKWAAFQQLFAGVSAGIATAVCTHPLDLIKTRMQSPPAPSDSANIQLIGMQLQKWVGYFGLRNRFIQRNGV